jgi:methylenetetrahydromethanopterin dehydrogenase
MVNVKGCFMTKEWEKYIPIVASAHEMMKVAAVLCDEAREIEKACDGVIRKPHKKDGVIVSKNKLIAKFE